MCRISRVCEAMFSRNKVVISSLVMARVFLFNYDIMTSVSTGGKVTSGVGGWGAPTGQEVGGGGQTGNSKLLGLP